MSNKGLWGKKTFCIVTGASQGIGRTVAIEFSKLIAAGSTIVITARSKQGLESTKKSMESAASGISVQVTTTTTFIFRLFILRNLFFIYYFIV